MRGVASIWRESSRLVACRLAFGAGSPAFRGLSAGIAQLAPSVESIDERSEEPTFHTGGAARAMTAEKLPLRTARYAAITPSARTP